MAFWSGNWSYLIRLLVYFICLVAFSIQLGTLIGNYIKPTIINTNVVERELKEIGFPLVLKICVSPAFNKTAITDAGYGGIRSFFLGQSMYNR